jgi:hypothetical protein
MKNIRYMSEYESPDGKHTIKLISEWEIRFGPAYFRIELDGKEIKDKFFGDTCLWSDDSKYVALELWLNTSEKDGPDTKLFIINTENLHFYCNPRAKNGFIKPIKFEKNIIVYKKIFYGNYAREEEFEVDLSSVSNWNKIILA